MKVLRYLLPVAVIAALGVPSLATAASCSMTSFHDETRSRDFEAVQEFVNSKRTIPLEEKDCNLSIAGDIRVDWAHIDEKIDGRHLRGEHGIAKIDQDANGCDTGAVLVEPNTASHTGFSKNEFDIEFNLYVDYVCDRTWGVVWLQFDNDAGIAKLNKNCTSTSNGAPAGLFGSGCCEDLCLKKAYFGYNVCADGCQRFDIEVGRRPMYSAFDSRMQFQSNFDGILLKYGRDMSGSCMGHMHWNTGVFVVDERADNYGYVSEIGFSDIMGCGFDVKYSYIDWKSLMTHNKNRCAPVNAVEGTNPHGSDFRVHQWSGSYTFDADYICAPVKLYGAFLWNSEAKRDVIPIVMARNVDGSEGTRGHDREDIGFYVGFLVGEVCCEGDWAFDASYQYAEAQVVPGRDFSGIGASGRNLLGENLYQAVTTTGFNSFGARDFTNIQGFVFDAIYAVTSNLTVEAILEFGREIDSNISGGKNTYSKFELQGIYAF